MIKKIYFPRLIIPMSKAVSGLIDFGITLIFIFALMAFYGVSLQPQFIFLPVFILLNVIAALGVGIWISSLTVRFRDFQYVLPFMVQLGLYSTPVAYPSSLIPEKYQFLYNLNPMAGIIDGFRWVILGTPSPGGFAYVSFLMIIILFISGLFYFHRVEKSMADLV